MKKTILFLSLFCLGAATATAQEAAAAPTGVGLQHTIAAMWSSNTYERGHLYGAQYDLRFRTPHRTIDWAIGGDIGFRSDKYTYTDFYTNIPYNNELRGINSAVHGLVLIGRKSLTLQTGLQVSWSNTHHIDRGSTIFYSYNPPDTFYTQTRVDITTHSYTDIIDAGISLGLRYQPARAMVFAAVGMDFTIFRAYAIRGNNQYGNGYPDTNYFFQSNSILFLLPNRLRLAVGYTFPVKYKK